eukprot:SAG31_NODE_16820_length_694_cov_1.194958_1_plen_85_part_01
MMLGLIRLLATTTALPAQQQQSVALGLPQLVFHGGISLVGSCGDFGLPDAPAWAWRDGRGQAHLAASYSSSWADSRYFSHGNGAD